MSAHTKGPWVVSEDGRTVGPAVQRRLTEAPRVQGVATVLRRPHRKETAANAALLALAPELLEALEEINGCIRHCDTSGEFVLAGKLRTLPALSKVRAALAKAGRTP